jgi:small conductance mechanosensitive channel
MADSSMDLVVRPWVKTDDYWPVRFDLTEKLKEALDEHGLTMPFTTQEVYIKSDAAGTDALKSA